MFWVKSSVAFHVWFMHSSVWLGCEEQIFTFFCSGSGIIVFLIATGWVTVDVHFTSVKSMVILVWKIKHECFFWTVKALPRSTMMVAYLLFFFLFFSVPLFSIFKEANPMSLKVIAWVPFFFLYQASVSWWKEEKAIKMTLMEFAALRSSSLQKLLVDLFICFNLNMKPLDVQFSVMFLFWTPLEDHPLFGVFSSPPECC